VPQSHVLMVVDHVLINAAFITSLLFVPVTSAYWPWWQSWWGRNIVILELCIAGTLLGSVLFLDFGISSVAFQWIAAFFLTAIILIVIWRAVMIWAEQRKGAREHSDYPNPRHEDRPHNGDRVPLELSWPLTRARPRHGSVLGPRQLLRLSLPGHPGLPRPAASPR
jgi:hypothetical protein